MLGRTGLSFLSPEGWLDFEAHESDLRGSRGVAIIGFLMLYMAICNFRNTVRAPFSLSPCFTQYPRRIAVGVCE